MSPPKAIVVDHDAPIRHLLGDILVEQGWMAHECAALPELDQIVELQPDLIFLELSPILTPDVPALLSALDAALPDKRPSLVLSCTDPKLMARLAGKPGHCRCVTLEKPFNMEALLATLERYAE